MYEYEKNHLRALRKGLAECTVLLKNKGDFPLREPGLIAAYGNGVRNTIKGGRQGFQMCSHTKSRYGKLTIKNNRCYSKKGRANALKITVNASGKRSAIRLVKKGNKLRKW